MTEKMPEPKRAAGGMAASLLAHLQSADLNVYPYRCACVRNRHASCLLCAQACTSGAISIEDGEVVVDSDLCVGCGTCATVCPTCALEARHPTDAELAVRMREVLVAGQDTLVVVCDSLWRRSAGRIDADRAVHVTCLGRVEESFLVDAVARGASRVLLAHGPCECCPRSAGVQTYGEVVENANLLLQTWGTAPCVELREKLPACVRLSQPAARPAAGVGFDESRREAFGQVGKAVAAAFGLECDAGDAASQAQGEGEGGSHDAARQADACEGAGATPGQAVGVDCAPEPGALVSGSHPLKVMLDGTLPHFLPDRRERLLDALAELGEPEDVALETRLWGRVEVDVSKCRTCLMCATFCPTGAISKVPGADGAVTLEHRPADCVKCRCCTDVCPTDALTLHEDVMAREVAGGDVACSFELPAVRDGRGGPHSMLGALKKLIHCDQLYER